MYIMHSIFVDTITLLVHVYTYIHTHFNSVVTNMVADGIRAIAMGRGQKPFHPARRVCAANASILPAYTYK